MVDEIINNRYKIVEKISEGGMSVVYKGLDEKSKKEVAIKILKKETISNRIEDIIRFRAEALNISKINHDKIIKIYEVGDLNYTGINDVKSLPYIVMEYINGYSLNDILLKDMDYSLENKIKIIIEIIEALEYIHSQGIIHRDLKPSNIMVINYDGRKELNIKIIDFGLAQVKDFTQNIESNEIVGTFGYMPPEQSGMIKSHVDERSDLYSAGILFYQLLTGRLPYEGKDVNSILHQHIAKMPDPLSRINKDIPEILGKIVLKLIEKEPEKRYQSAKGLLSDLKRYENGEYYFELGLDDIDIKLSYQTNLIGREEELNRLKMFFKKASSSSGSLCFVSGEAGKGKTRLINELKKCVYGEGGIFIEGKCFSGENKIPYLPFKEALNVYLKIFNNYSAGKREDIKMKLKDVVGELGEIILRIEPLMKEVIGDCPSLIALEPEKENQRFLMVVSRFFQGLSRIEGVLVILMDDLQWVEDGSISLLNELTRDISNAPILLIGNYRDNEVPEDHKLQKFKDDLKKDGIIFGEINLSNFDGEKINRFVSSLLYDKEENVKDISDILLKKSKGNPFFCIELIRLLVDNKVIERKEGVWKTNRELLNRIEFSSTIVDTLLKRILLLNQNEKELLSHASLIGRKFDIDLLFCILENYEKEVVVRIIDKAIGLQLVEVDSTEKGKLLFVHDRIKEAFEKIIDDSNKEKIHLKIGYNIEEKYKEEIDKNIYNFSLLFDLVNHYVECGDREKILKYAYPAGVKAKDSYANDDAIRYFTIIIKILGSVNDKFIIDCKKNIVEIYLVIGKFDDAIELSKEILNFEKNRIEKSKIYKQITHAYFKKGNWDDSERYAKIGLKLLGEKLPVKKIEVIVSILKEFIRYLFYSLFSGIFIRKKSNSKSEKYKLIIWYYYATSWVYSVSDNIKFARCILRMKNISDTKIGISEEMALSYNAFGGLLMAIAFFKKAKVFYKKAIEISESFNYKWTLGQSYQLLCANYLWSGQYNTGIECGKKSTDIFDNIGDLRELGTSSDLLANNYFNLSLYNNALKENNIFIKTSINSNNIYESACTYNNLQMFYLEMGDYKNSEKYCIKGYEISIDNKIFFTACISFIYLGYLYYEQGFYDKSLYYLNNAKELNEKYSFIKHYTVNFYPILCDLYIEIYKNDISNNEKITIKKIKKSCKHSLRVTKNWRTHYGHALRVNAKYYALIGKNKEAEKYFLQSMEHCMKIGRRYEEAKGYYEYGLFLDKINRKEEAKLKWEKAYQIFKDIDAKVYIKRTSDLLGIISGEMDEDSSICKLRYKQKLLSVIGISQDISLIFNLNELLERIMEKAIEITGAQTGLLFIYNEDLKELDLKAGKNIVNDDMVPKFSRNIIEKVYASGKTILTTNAEKDKDFNKFNSVKALGLKSILCLPIMLHEKKIGVCYLDNPLTASVFSQEEVELLEAIMAQAAISIEYTKLYQKIQFYKNKAEEEVEKLSIHISQKEIRYDIDDKSSIVYRSRIMKKVINTVEEANKISKPVLITGETGTGKELIAKMIKNPKNPDDKSFIAINCAAVTQSLWESELFGYVKGAFTDAKTNNPGCIAKASGGITFFDEIAEIPLDIQAKLLRLLQENQYRQVGGNDILDAHCRFVFATNKNIEKMVASGNFREDLYYRINIFHIHLPPLRDRSEDIPFLLNHFFKKYSQEFNLVISEIEKGALDVLLSYNWPGNVRELENLVIRTMAMISSNEGNKSKNILTLKDLPASFSARNQKDNINYNIYRNDINGDIHIDQNYPALVNNYSKQLIMWALKRANGNKTEAADILGIKRTTLIYKIKELNIN